MSYILDNPDAIINIKLTNYGRKQLASGKLTYDYYAFGDSEIDYSYGQTTSLNVKNDISENKVLAPKDNYTKLKNILVPNLLGTSYSNLLDSITGNPLSMQLPQEIVAENAATERGFFSGDTSSGFSLKVNSDILRDWGTTSQSNVNGTNTISVSFAKGSDTLQSGDHIVFAMRSPALSGSTETLGDIPLNENLQYLTYQIVGVTGTYPNKSLTLDRNLPNFSSGSNNVNCYVIAGGDAINEFYGSASTTNYWTPGTLSFEDPCLKSVDDVDIINMNIVYFDNMIGTQPSVGQKQYTEYGSTRYNGINELFDYNLNKVHNGNPFSLGIIHYTNHSVSNYYGEYFTGVITLNFPSVMYHRSPNGDMGLTLTADTSNPNNSLPTNAGFQYYPLNDNAGSTVGKVFPDQRIVVVEDQEILAALSYKSNRNYTTPDANVQTYTFGSPSLLSPNERLWVTYMFGGVSAYTSGVTHGYGNSIPNLNVQKIDHPNTSTSSVDVSLSVPTNGLQFYQDPSEVGGNGGFNAQNLYILVQKTSNTAQKPLASQWKIIDVTNKFTGGITKAQLNASPPTVVITSADYNSGTTFNINDYGFSIPTTSDDLIFGDEVVMFGNLNTNIAAKIYRTKFICRAPIGKFNESPNNKTYNGKKTYVSEVGIYDKNKKLVAIGKLGQPILKQSKGDLDTDKDLLIELQLDF